MTQVEFGNLWTQSILNMIRQYCGNDSDPMLTSIGFILIENALDAMRTTEKMGLFKSVENNEYCGWIALPRNTYFESRLSMLDHFSDEKFCNVDDHIKLNEIGISYADILNEILKNNSNSSKIALIEIASFGEANKKLDVKKGGYMATFYLDIYDEFCACNVYIYEDYILPFIKDMNPHHTRDNNK